MKVISYWPRRREHAHLRKVSESALVEKVFVAPGNAGMDRCGGTCID